MTDVQQPTSGKTALLWVLLFLLAMWTVQTISWQADISFTPYGLFPRTAEGLRGILTMPFIHGDLDHIWNNSFGLLVTAWMILFAYPKAAKPTIALSWLLTGLGVWAFGRPAFHIGASGLVYAFSSFIFFSSVLRRTREAIGYCLIVSFFFGASIWGLLPFQQGVSWEGHLAGSLSGMICAILWRNRDRPPTQESQPEKPFQEPKHWPVSEIPYLEGTALHPPAQNPLPQQPSRPPSHGNIVGHD